MNVVAPYNDAKRLTHFHSLTIVFKFLGDFHTMTLLKDRERWLCSQNFDRGQIQPFQRTSKSPSHYVINACPVMSLVDPYFNFFLHMEQKSVVFPLSHCHTRTPDPYGMINSLSKVRQNKPYRELSDSLH